MLWDCLETLPIKRAWQRESWRRVRRSGMGTSGVDAKLRPRCEPVMAELMCGAGSGNLRCTGCAHREAICHFGRYSERTDVARKTERFGSAMNLRLKPLVGLRTGKFAIRG